MEFRKLHVCGNDFVFIATSNVAERTEAASLARHVCNRMTGIGADQLVLFQLDQEDLLALDIYNPDGSGSRFCGNACLAAAHLAVHRLGARTRMRIVLPSTSLTAYVEAERSEIVMPIPTGYRRLAMTDGPPGSSDQFFIENGTLHRIVLCTDVDAIDLDIWGPRLSKLDGMAEPVNVMFVALLNKERLQLRPWERGGTGPTSACGSGASAAAWLLAQLGQSLPMVEVACPGGPLQVCCSAAQLRLAGAVGEIMSGQMISLQPYF